jgi:hypothetical protein
MRVTEFEFGSWSFWGGALGMGDGIKDIYVLRADFMGNGVFKNGSVSCNTHLGNTYCMMKGARLPATNQNDNTRSSSLPSP